MSNSVNWLMPSNWSEEGRQRNLKKAQVSKLLRTKEHLNAGANKMTTAHENLGDTVSNLDGYITALEQQDLTVFKNTIDEGYDLDQEYKDQLKNEMEKERQRTIAELVPLKRDAEKLRAHMFVSQYKVHLWATKVQAKAEIVESAQIQVDELKQLKEDGDAMSTEIGKILEDCESLNNAYGERLKGKTGVTMDANFTDLMKNMQPKVKDVGPK